LSKKAARWRANSQRDDRAWRVLTYKKEGIEKKTATKGKIRKRGNSSGEKRDQKDGRAVMPRAEEVRGARQELALRMVRRKQKVKIRRRQLDRIVERPDSWLEKGLEENWPMVARERNARKDR